MRPEAGIIGVIIAGIDDTGGTVQRKTPI